MVQSCCAYNCTERASIKSNYAFHRFPIKNKALLKEWCIAIRRKDFKPQKHSRICSKHFSANSYKTGVKFRKLKKNAIPTIFDFGESKKIQRKGKCKKAEIAASASSKRFISSKCGTGYLEDYEEIKHFSSTSENECDLKDTVIEVIKLENYNNEQISEYNSTDSEILKNCDEDDMEIPESSSSERITDNDNIVQLQVPSNLSEENENVKLRQAILLLHKRMEKFMFLIESLQATNMISEEAAFVLSSALDM